VTETPATAEPRYNRIYEKLVTAEDDVAGMIAYALYKQSKREWLRNFEAEHRARPSPSDIDAYVLAYTKYEFERLRSQADSILSAYAAVVIDAETPSLREEIITSHVMKQVSQTLLDVKRQGSLLRQFITGAFLALGYTILLFGIAVALKFAGIDLLGIVEKVGPPA
jgi:hypothetical protein